MTTIPIQIVSVETLTLTSLDAYVFACKHGSWQQILGPMTTAQAHTAIRRLRAARTEANEPKYTITVIGA